MSSNPSIASEYNTVQRSYDPRPCGRRHSPRSACPECSRLRLKAPQERLDNPIGADFRQWIYSRDDFSCNICGTDRELSVDHKIPVVRGGRTDPDNLHTLCVSCNAAKGSLTWEEYGEKYE